MLIANELVSMVSMKFISTHKVWAVFTLLILLVALFRVFPHPANFTPLLALIWAINKILPKKEDRWVRLIAAVSPLLISDAWLGFSTGALPTYLYLGGTALWWMVGTHRLSWLAFPVSSLGFFLFSNTAVWAFSGMYPVSWAGFVECFTLALPFFRNQLLGDFSFGCLFAVIIWAARLAPARPYAVTRLSVEAVR